MTCPQGGTSRTHRCVRALFFALVLSSLGNLPPLCRYLNADGVPFSAAKQEKGQSRNSHGYFGLWPFSFGPRGGKIWLPTLCLVISPEVIDMQRTKFAIGTTLPASLAFEADHGLAQGYVRQKGFGGSEEVAAAAVGTPRRVWLSHFQWTAWIC